MSPLLRSGLLLCAVATSGLFSGCVTLTGPPPPPSYAFDHPDQTRLGQEFAEAARNHPGESGYHILEYGLESLVARIALADQAERTIDAQYYIYDSDEAGSILAEHLIAAADRGVRVRLLLDDYNLGSDRELAALCVHPHIEVRVFNPISFRPRWGRIPAYILQLPRADHRMHNKLFIADGEVTILGGRNVGNDYFNIHTRSLFRDLDVLTVGPITRQASAAFDKYWNSPWAVPATRLVHRAPTRADLAWEIRRIHSRVKNASEFESEFATGRRRYLADLGSDAGSLIWARGEIISDPPRKLDADASPPGSVADRLEEAWPSVKKTVEIEAAYFVPGAEGVPNFRRLRGRGVSVKLLTSALEATDIPVVYCAYKNYRRDVLEAGVDLYEFKLRPAQARKGKKWYRLRPSYAALHSKVIILDRENSWIGSFNLDPRSADLNTEIAVRIESREFAEKLADTIAEDFTPARSWHLRLVGNHIVWDGEEDGKPVELRHEPETFGKRIEVFFLSLMPIKSQL